MKTKAGAALLAGTLVLAAAVPCVAAGGHRAGSRGIGGGSIQTQTRQMDRSGTRDMEQRRMRLDDGDKQGNTYGPGEKQGNAYGPGDGTGNMGTGPQDGTGYGAPGTR